MVRKCLILCIVFAAAGVGYVFGKSSDGRTEVKSPGTKDKSLTKEATGKPIFFDDYDRVLVLKTEKGELEFSVPDSAKIMRDSVAIGLGSISSKLKTTVNYETGHKKNFALEIFQSVQDSIKKQ